MTEILLVNPKLPIYFRKNGVHLLNNIMNPVSMSIIASLLRDKYDTEILDANALRIPHDKVIKKINDINPDWVIITSNMMNRWQCPLPQDDHFLPLLKGIKKSKTILIGPHPTINPEAYRQIADKIVVGEPESAFPQILENDEKVVRTNYIVNLDSLPYPAYDMLPMEKYGGTIYVVTSRGCPFQCIFCYKDMYGAKYRVRSVDNVLRELECLVNDYEISHIGFLDLEFALDKERVVNLCNCMIERGLKISWSCGCRADMVDFEMLKIMKEAGCSSITFGIETGIDKILKKIKKGIKLQDSKNAVLWARKAGIKTIGTNFIIGWPSETREDIEKSYKFFRNLGSDTINCSISIPYPRTSLNESASIGNNWDDVLKSAGTVGNSFTKKEIIMLKKRINHRMAFYKLKRLPDYATFVLFSTNKRYNLSLRGIKNILGYIRNIF